MAATSFLIHPQLGQFPFIRLTLPPPGRRFHGLVEARPGVNGYSFWKEAARGIPWRSAGNMSTRRSTAYGRSCGKTCWSRSR